eukprot:TRINITY_DN34266_c0_g1_i1.p1 TRINITY_DN34266_c0_g1~~TRINITY_DN34266_c0_g1_i1.p1  ORF type:complete len:191 (+),score=12.33 TRINITY_DN34266_c0_g1_i1:48-620(+)
MSDVVPLHSRLWMLYNLALQVKPFQTKLATSLVLDTLSDIFSQLVLQRKRHWDYKRTLKMSSFTLIINPIIQGWYKLLFSLIKDPSFSGTIFRVLLDQTLFSFFINALFVTYMSVYEGERDVSVIWDDVKKRTPQYVKAGWLVWPAALLISFRFVPEQFRTLFGTLVGFCWSCYLTIKNSKDKKKRDEGD